MNFNFTSLILQTYWSGITTLSSPYRKMNTKPHVESRNWGHVKWQKAK